MLALSCLDMVIELDVQNTWTSILSARGYLKFIIDSLLEADRHLIALLSTQIKSLRPLYVYESKMVNIPYSHSGYFMMELYCISFFFRLCYAVWRQKQVVLNSFLSRMLSRAFLPYMSSINIRKYRHTP